MKWLCNLGFHRMKIETIRQFGSFSWRQYETSSTCFKCGFYENRIFDINELVDKGFNREKILKIDSGILNFSKDARDYK